MIMLSCFSHLPFVGLLHARYTSLPATLRVASACSSDGIFDAEFTKLFPDLSNKPETTLAMHQSPDGAMYWIAGQEGILLRVGAGRYHHVHKYVKKVVCVTFLMWCRIGIIRHCVYLKQQSPSVVVVVSDLYCRDFSHLVFH